MPSWTKQEYEAWRIAKLRNAVAEAALWHSKLESSAPMASNAKDEGTAQSPVSPVGHAQIHVRITSRRRRLLDPDNLSAKALVDALRFARLIPDDRPQDIALEVRQEKVASKSEECTVIELMEQARP